MDWKDKTPEYFNLFFNCRSQLIETFKTLYGDQLTFEGSRAIVLNLKETPLKEILQHCFTLALITICLNQNPCREVDPKKGQELHSLLPNSSFQSIPDSNHLVHMDQPDVMIKEILDFF